MELVGNHWDEILDEVYHQEYFKKIVAFINKGNALAMAVGVILGGAFSGQGGCKSGLGGAFDIFLSDFDCSRFAFFKIAIKTITSIPRTNLECKIR